MVEQRRRCAQRCIGWHARRATSPRSASSRNCRWRRARRAARRRPSAAGLSNPTRPLPCRSSAPPHGSQSTGSGAYNSCPLQPPLAGGGGGGGGDAGRSSESQQQAKREAAEAEKQPQDQAQPLGSRSRRAQGRGKSRKESRANTRARTRACMLPSPGRMGASQQLTARLMSRCVGRNYSEHGAEMRALVRPPTTWTILQNDDPNHLGMRCNAFPEHQMALITSGCVPFRATPPGTSESRRSSSSSRVTPANASYPLPFLCPGALVPSKHGGGVLTRGQRAG